jgi:hypothetical protein
MAKTKQTLYLDGGQRERAHALAAALGLSLAEVIRRLIAAWLDGRIDVTPPTVTPKE